MSWSRVIHEKQGKEYCQQLVLKQEHRSHDTAYGFSFCSQPHRELLEAASASPPAPQATLVSTGLLTAAEESLMC